MLNMKPSRRPSLVTGLCVLAAGTVIAAFFFSGDSPQTSASQFMSALAEGDVKALTDRSFMDGESAESVMKKWEYATQVASPHYAFAWQAVGQQVNGPDSASVTIQLVRNADSPASYPDKYGIPLVKRDGKWLVDVRALDRKIYPNLPR
jgi:hypothetical protein